MIKYISFDHKGGWYFYRVHQMKTELLPNGFSSLKKYLYDMFESCPHDYFNEGPRISALKFKLENLDLHRVKKHEVCELTKHGLIKNGDRYKTAHSKVQVFMLENDNKTLAVEIPIWLELDEMKKIDHFNKLTSPLTGHIDLLRVEDEKVWIWDYKPNASKEKYASTQTFFYALMLSQRSGINLEQFRCGYFDEKDAFIFKPEVKLLNKKILNEFV